MVGSDHGGSWVLSDRINPENGRDPFRQQKYLSESDLRLRKIILATGRWMELEGGANWSQGDLLGSCFS